MSQILSAVRASTAALRTARAIPRTQAYFHATRKLNSSADPRDNLGGPHGQEPIPERPGGPDALKRNWFPIVGGALVIVGGLVYLTRSPDSEKLITKGKELENRAKAQTKAVGNHAAAKARELENKAANYAGGADSPKPLQEMSGRKADSSWRAE